MAINDLNKILKTINPSLNEGLYVFISLKTMPEIPRKKIIAEMKELEGTSLIISEKTAKSFQLPYEGVFSWITLTVHSSLTAVGLTAAFSTALAKEKISCNVVAGFFHDHIFVLEKDADKAMQVLTQLKDSNYHPNY